MSDDAHGGRGGSEVVCQVNRCLLVLKGHKDYGALARAQGPDALGEGMLVEFEGGCWSGAEGFGTKPLEELFAPVAGATQVEDHHSAGAEDEGLDLVGFAEAAGAQSLQGGYEDLLGEVFSRVVV